MTLMWPLSRFFGRLKIMVSCEKSEDTIFDKVRKLRLKISSDFPHVKTEELRTRSSVKI